MIPDQRPTLLRLVAFSVALLVVVAIHLNFLQPPQVGERSTTPSNRFSAERALDVLTEIARSPRPLGTPAHDAARQAIVRRIEALGLEATIQREDMQRVVDGYSQSATVANVLTRLPGRKDGASTLLWVAHYDTVNYSPGAGDDGAGVAALLETLRALVAGPALDNELIFLFSDAEERGLLGAHAFLRHPWAARVDMVINLEARGARGPSILFELGPSSETLLARAGRLKPDLLAFSFSQDVYRRLPNDTDLSVFAAAGLPGFNFAFIDDIKAYHSPLDTVERLDLRSLQDHGEHALVLSRGFGDLDLASLPPAAPTLWFSVPFMGLVAYPRALVWPLAILAVLLFGAILARGPGGSPRKLVALIRGPILLFLAATLIALISFGLGRIAADLLDQDAPQPALLRLLWVVVALLMAGVVQSRMSRKAGLHEGAVGAGALWLAFALLTSRVAPLSSYLFVLPPLAMLVSWAALFSQRIRGLPASARLALAVLLACPTLAVWTPAIALSTTLNDQGAAPMTAFSTVLVASTLLPQYWLCGVDDGATNPVSKAR